MYATAYSIVGVLLVGALVLGVGLGVGMWLAVRALRPELMDRSGPGPNDDP